MSAPEAGAPPLPPGEPELLHSGTYALYATPEGGRHLVYRRCQSVNGAGELADIEGAEDEHLPTVPAEALPLLSQFLEHGIPAPVMAVLQGRHNPIDALRALTGQLGGPDA